MKRLFLVLLTLSLVFACHYQSGIVQRAEKGFIKFTGNIENVSVQIDDAAPFTISDENKLYQVSPGRHTVKAYRNQNLVVDRVLIIDNETTTEIVIP